MTGKKESIKSRATSLVTHSGHTWFSGTFCQMNLGYTGLTLSPFYNQYLVGTTNTSYSVAPSSGIVTITIPMNTYGASPYLSSSPFATSTPLEGTEKKEQPKKKEMGNTEEKTMEIPSKLMESLLNTVLDGKLTKETLLNGFIGPLNEYGVENGWCIVPVQKNGQNSWKVVETE